MIEMILNIVFLVGTAALFVWASRNDGGRG